MGNSPYDFTEQSMGTIQRKYKYLLLHLPAAFNIYQNGMIWYFARVTTMLSVKYKQILVA